MYINKAGAEGLKDGIKNIAKGTFLETLVDKGFYILTSQNNNNYLRILERHLDSDFIQFHFCIKGTCAFNFNEGRYKLGLSEEHSLLLYNPQQDLPINVEISPNSWLVSILISIKKFHSLFSKEADYITFLSEDNKDKKNNEKKRK